MEVYNSSHTAEELEYALSAVPSIGDNGNWYIGEEDTGVFAGGIDVTGAEVGQIIKVAEVDANGRPTAWTSEDAISGWTLLGSADSIDADVVEITIEKDVNGNAFSVDELFIYGVFPSAAATSSVDLKLILNDESSISFVDCVTKSTITNRGVYIDIPKKAGILRPNWAMHGGASTTSVTSAVINKYTTVYDIEHMVRSYIVDKITKISFLAGDGGAFNTLTCFRVYGR